MTLKLPRRFRRKQFGYLSLTHMCGFGGRRSGAVAAGKVLTYKGTSYDATNITNPTTYTFSTLDFGTASADRVVHAVVAIRLASSGIAITVTIGGVAATQNVNLESSKWYGGVYSAVVPSGTTGDIVVTCAANATACAVTWYASTGLSSAIAVSTVTGNANDAHILTTVAGGFFIAGNFNQNTRTTTWTNATEDVDDTSHAGAGEIVAYAMAHDATVGASVTITDTLSGTPGTSNGFVAASF